MYEASQDEAKAALDLIRKFLKTISRRTNETDTIRRAIEPILTDVLGFSREDLHSTIDPSVSYNGRKLYPDLIYKSRKGTNISVVIEAKSAKVNIFGSKHGGDGGFKNAIDQTLTYLDAFGSAAAIVSNGWDWWLFQVENTKHSNTDRSCYTGLHVRLDWPNPQKEVEIVRTFISIFHQRSVIGIGDDELSLPSPMPLEWERAFSIPKSIIRFYHFVDLPLTGHGSGFSLKSLDPDFM